VITLVLAGSLTQFNDWCREQGVNPRDRSVARYVRDQGDCRGITQHELKAVVCGTFWDRTDAVILYEWAHLAVSRSQSFGR
jgi:hypothetical protein